ncbi:hypothetical protein [Lysobacter firmicutimachus]|uniref:Uncharacterized protein n=1 Tax=Lysobacter firmicutimachus TaxID=1792846 RepID=A0ABU8D7I5_9GAMM
MTLDLVQARHEREALTSRKSFAIELLFHRQLMARALPHEAYPLLLRLRDYGADAAWSSAELPVLQAELTRLQTRFTDPADIRRLSLFVAQALADGDNLYAIAD